MRETATISFASGLQSPRAGERVETTAAGFNMLATLHRNLSIIRDTDVIVDFSGISWVDGHLTPSLQTVFLQAQQKGNIIRLSKILPPIYTTFCKNRLVVEKRSDIFNTVMPVTMFETDGDKDFSAYAKRYLDRPEMPKMTQSLRGRFFEGIDELFANSSLHSRTGTPIVVGGQFYPKLQRLSFSIVDGGEGMHGAVCARLKRDMPPEIAIGWAMEPFNTTRQGDVPGGIGSKILREFIELNKGKITVVSNGGFWSQHGSQVTKVPLKGAYPGTAVVLEVNTSDRQSYDLVKPPRASDIW